jgi:DNA-binding phage protein
MTSTSPAALVATTLYRAFSPEVEPKWNCLSAWTRSMVGVVQLFLDNMGSLSVKGT